jgi:hypothetical protein
LCIAFLDFRIGVMCYKSDKETKKEKNNVRKRIQRI